MANTRFEPGQIIEETYRGRRYRFRALKAAEEGSGSVYGPAEDLTAGRRVFLKKYIDPAPRTPWLPAFVDYHRKLLDRIEASPAAKQLVAGMEFFQDERNRFWQVIEYVDNSRDLKSYLLSSDTTWNQRVTFAKVFMFAMRILHEELRLVHGDLKPANLLLVPAGDSYRIKLIDFDRPVFLDEETIPWAASDGYLGSPGYRSPEHVGHRRPTDKSDVFTCGIILYELLSKQRHPFGGNTVSGDYSAASIPEPEFWGSFGSPGWDAAVARTLHAMLDPYPAKRPTAAEVHQVLMTRPDAEEPLRPFVPQDPLPPPPPSPPVEGAADIVLLIDATGSMGPFIRALKEHVHSFLHSLAVGNSETGVEPVPDWRARVVGFRNFADCNQNATVERAYRRIGRGGWLINNPFTRDEDELHRQLDSLKAFGGGQDPRESLLDALMLVLKSGFLPPAQKDAAGNAEGFRWRRNGAGRVVVVFTDAGFLPEMSYSPDRTRFEERDVYPFDLVGAGLDELQNEIEAGFFKLYVFAPNIPDYDGFSDLPHVVVAHGDGEGGGFKMVVDSGFESLIDDIVKGVSRSSSEFREMEME